MSGPVPWLAGTVAISAVFGLAAPRLVRRIPPTAAVWLLSVGSIVVAAGAVVAPALIVLTVVGQWPPLAGLGQWSAGPLASSVSADSALAIAAVIVSGLQAWRLGRAVWTDGRALVSAWMACRGATADLVVIPETRPVAFAVPGWPGKVVASRGLLQQLGPAERRAVLAHEQGHLRARHDLHILAGSLAAAADPLLLRIPSALRLATERSADECSAAATGDRALVATAIGSAAALCSSHRRFVPAMEAAGSDVPVRVHCLLECPPRRRPVLEGVLAALAVAAVALAAVGAFDTKHLFEIAERAHVLAAIHR